MYTLKQAKSEAKALSKLHGEPWLVCRPSPNAPCSTYPGNLFNKGPYVVVRACERNDYELGGCQFE